MPLKNTFRSGLILDFYNLIESDPIDTNMGALLQSSSFGSGKSFERAFLVKYNETPYKFIIVVMY